MRSASSRNNIINTKKMPYTTILTSFLLLSGNYVNAFIAQDARRLSSFSRVLPITTTCDAGISFSSSRLEMSSSVSAEKSFIKNELRSAAMKLHTTMQAPKEGKVVVEEPKERYVATHDDYLAFLVDSRHVYQALEEIVNATPELEKFRNTGLERTKSLDQDIDYLVKEFNLEMTDVGEYGKTYASDIRKMIENRSIPEFMCHYYNFYFAHTAGGRRIGRMMSFSLLNKKVLQFHKWDRPLNKVSAEVKDNIEEIAATWTQEEKDECVAGTPGAFRGGGGLNAYLFKGKNA